MNETALIRVTQLPVIEERLREAKREVENITKTAASMVCTEETVQAVKSRRAELKKQFEALEEQRKAVKKAVLEPYERFEAVYKDCITGPFNAADAALKEKIADIEGLQKSECEKKCRDYFSELCAIHGVDFLRFEQAGLKISLTEAKKKSPSGHFDKLSEFVARVACDMDAIGDDAETAAEYKSNGLNLAKAQKTVRERHEAQEAERKSAEERTEHKRREAEAVAKVEAAAPPVVASPPAVVETPAAVEEKPAGKWLRQVSFTIHFDSAEQFAAVKPVLVALREKLKEAGIRYE